MIFLLNGFTKILENFPIRIVLIFMLLQLFFASTHKEYPWARFKGWYVNFIVKIINESLYFFIVMLFFPIATKFKIYGCIPYFKDFHPIIKYAILVLILDFVVYWGHYFYHSIKFLRRIHNVHHVVHYIDVMSAFRVHFIEVLTYAIILIGVYFPLGVTVEEFIIIAAVNQMAGILLHADLRLPYQLEILLDKVFCTSGFHMHHHSINTKEANENFGMVFTFWDRINKTYHAPEKGRKYVYGTRTDLTSSNSLVKNLFLRLPYTNGAGLRAYKR
ncbi:MAG: sterol desaturase family protein [Bacteriovoracaceae bacterium]